MITPGHSRYIHHESSKVDPPSILAGLKSSWRVEVKKTGWTRKTKSGGGDVGDDDDDEEEDAEVALLVVAVLGTLLKPEPNSSQNAL